jgi:hypothetical protein
MIKSSVRITSAAGTCTGWPLENHGKRTANTRDAKTTVDAARIANNPAAAARFPFENFVNGIA